MADTLNRAGATARSKLDPQLNEKAPPRPSDMPSTPSKGARQQPRRVHRVAGGGGGCQTPGRPSQHASFRHSLAAAPRAQCSACPIRHYAVQADAPPSALFVSARIPIWRPACSPSTLLPTRPLLLRFHLSAAGTGRSDRTDVSIRTNSQEGVRLEVDTHEGGAAAGGNSGGKGG